MALMDVLDESGKPTGITKSKREIHEQGLWHMASWVWIYNDKGEILLQQRSKIKDNHPGLWDISAAGHVDAEETPLIAAVREIEEEIGLNIKPDQLKLIDKKIISKHNPTNDWEEREISYVYLLQYDGSVEELTLQESEVEKMEFVDSDLLEKDLEDSIKSKKYVGHGKHYNEVIAAVKKELLRAK